jgi:inner membrane protein
MASVFSHAAVALTLGRVKERGTPPARFWWLSVFCAALPDADVAGFVFGIRYGDVLGHRGLSHSLPFALLCAIVVVDLAFRETRRFSRRRPRHPADPAAGLWGGCQRFWQDRVS